METTELLNLEVYPNPTAKQVYVEVDGNRLGDVKLAVFDLYGKKMKSYRVPNEGFRQVSLNLKDLKVGTYMIRLESQKMGAVSQKLVIER
ncbi:MAG: T9SS type A sorting domain-containing protein [Flammeovirgaceae bacterium]